MSDCPLEGDLESFLNGVLGASEAAELERHLAACFACQYRIDSLCPEGEESSLRSDSADPTFDPSPEALSRLTRRTLSALAQPGPNSPLELPGYEIGNEIGRGGMGVVYRARHVALGRPVALKVLLGGVHAPEKERERFRREASTAAGFQHPDIVRVYEVGEHCGVAYFAMEFVAGGSLDRRLDGTPWPASAAAKLVETVARAVQHAHDRGVVHRDLKPANILLAYDREARTTNPSPKVTDFGLARLLESNGVQTRTGSLLGTPSYMAPEQVSGSTREIGPPADVYALGAILYELLVGRPPFADPDVVETLVQVRFHDPVPPRRFRPALPRDLDTVALKCLQKAPALRYSTAGELADDLRRFLEGRPVLARPARAWERASKAARRHPWIAALSTGCLVFLSVGFSLVFAQWRRAEYEADAARRATDREHEAKEDALRLTAATVLDLGISLCERGDIGQGLLELDRGERLAEQVGDTNLQWIARANRVAWQREWFPVASDVRHPGRLLAVAYSLDGRRLATAGDDNSVRFWDADTGRCIAIHARVAPVQAMACSPDSTGFIAGSTAYDGEEPRGEVRFWSANGQTSRAAVRFPAPVRSLDVSDEGKRYLVATASGLWVGDMATGSPERIADVPHLDSTARFVGDRIVLIGRRQLSVVSVEGQRLWDCEHVAPLVGHAFDPSGQFVAAADRERVIRVRSVASGKAVAEFTALPGPIRAMAFSPDGKFLATCSDLALLNAEVESRLRRDVPAELRVWEVTTGQPKLAPIRLPRRSTALAFSPCGRLLLAGGDDGAARLFRLSDGVGMGKPLAHPGRVQSVAFRRDGRAFLVAGGSGRSGDARRESVVECREMPVGHGEQNVTLAHDEIVYRIAFDPNGDSVWIGDWTRPPRRWNAKTGAAWPVTALPDVPEPTWLTRKTAPAPRPPDLRIWDMAIGQQLAPGAHFGPGRAVVFSPDGRVALVASHDRTVLWDMTLWQQIGDPLSPAGGCSSAAFRADGSSVLVVGVDRTATVYDTATGTRRTSWVFPTAVWSVAFHPGGRLLAAAGPGASVRLWDAVEGEPMGPPMSHREAGVLQVAFHPDGRLLATGGRDATVRLWDVATGRSLGPPLTFSDRVTALAFDPTGATLAVGVENRSVELRSLHFPR